jgi:hypothetical protein
LDNDTPGVAERTLEQVRSWPPVLPVFGQITPFPATPLYERLSKDGRLTRPKHWLDFAPFQMAHKPLRMSIDEVQKEVRHGWTESYHPQATRQVMESLRDEPVPYRISHLVARIFFQGIYFPTRGVRAWMGVVWRYRASIAIVIREAFTNWHGKRGRDEKLEFEGSSLERLPAGGD